MGGAIRSKSLKAKLSKAEIAAALAAKNAKAGQGTKKK